MMACTFSSVMRRSAWFWPAAGVPWLSAKMTSSLAPPSPGQALAVGQRKVLQVGVAVVDEVDGQLDGGLGEVAGTRRVAAQRIDRADLDGLLRRRCARDANTNSAAEMRPAYPLDSRSVFSATTIGRVDCCRRDP